MRKLHNEKGFSRVEIFCITGITLMVLFLVCMGVRWHQKKQFMGEDKIMVNTARSAAEAGLVGSDCPVRGCSGGETCTHRQADGSHIGYFGHPLHTITGEKCAGYNAYKVMEIDDRKYRGAAKTMVIQVKAKDGELTLSWVKGL